MDLSDKDLFGFKKNAEPPFKNVIYQLFGLQQYILGSFGYLRRVWPFEPFSIYEAQEICPLANYALLPHAMSFVHTHLHNSVIYQALVLQHFSFGCFKKTLVYFEERAC